MISTDYILSYIFLYVYMSNTKMHNIWTKMQENARKDAGYFSHSPITIWFYLLLLLISYFLSRHSQHSYPPLLYTFSSRLQKLCKYGSTWFCTSIVFPATVIFFKYGILISYLVGKLMLLSSVQARFLWSFVVIYTYIIQYVIYFALC